MTPPRPVTRYAHSSLETEFAALLEAESGQENVQVHITRSGLADLDQDGSVDDCYGVGLAQVGSRFESFIFLRREDGSTRFLENSGARLDLSSGMRPVYCFESRAWLCRPAMERALRVIDRPRVSIMNYDASRAGIEVVIRSGGSGFLVLNSLELFASGAR